MGLRHDSRVIVIRETGDVGPTTVAAARCQNIHVVSTSRYKGDKNQIGFEMPTNSIVNAIPNLRQHDVIILLASYRVMGWIHENPKTVRDLNVSATVK